MNFKLIVRICLLLISIVPPIFCQGFWGNEFPEGKIEYEPKSYVCYKTIQPVILDGKITEKAWADIPWTNSFVDIEGSLKPKPYNDTKVKMLWDRDYFYFAVYMKDPHVWATLKERDAVIYKDNDFEIFLDPDGDTHNYYELEVNALGTEWDLLITKPYHDGGKVALDSWDIPDLITNVHIDGTLNDPSDLDNGWSIEIAIPWKAFIGNYRSNNAPKDGEQWKVNFSRVHWETNIINSKYVKTDRPEYNWVWSPQGIIYMHMPDLWGLVQFTENTIDEKIVPFKDGKIDKIKWSLRQLYYKQRNYFFANDRYSDSIRDLNFFSDLKLKKTPFNGVSWPPKITLTPSGWEAFVTWENKNIIIRKDGRVWVQ